MDPSMAELDFRRLVLEFPGGPYTDDALFRLGLSADLKGELTEARDHFERLVRDHPSSPRVREAREWIEAHGRELEALPDEPAPLEVSGARRPIPMAEPRESGEFAVQLGAFRSLERALSLAQEVRDAGYSPRVVRTPGSDLARVRVGRFPSREAATELSRLLVELGFEVTLATDAGSEERVGTGQGMPPL